MGVWWQLAIGVVVLWFVLRFVGTCSVPENPPSHSTILWWKILLRVLPRPRSEVRTIDMARWLWQSLMRRTRIAVIPLAICKSVFSASLCLRGGFTPV